MRSECAMNRQNVSMVILAGGKSSRMGREKADLLYQGKTFLENQIQKGRNIGITDILVSGYKGSDCSARVIEDEVAFQGPLGGLQSSLPKAEGELVLVLGVDMVLVPEEDLQELLRQAKNTEKKAVILSHGGKEEPLIGVYHTSLTADMKRELTTGKGSVFAFLKRIGYEVFRTKTPDHCFLNINDPETYKRLDRLEVQ